MARIIFPATIAVCVIALLISSVQAADEYRTADEAFSAGAKLHNAKQYAQSQAPFEAALKLAPNDAFRLKTYRALLPAYRQLGEIDKFLEAADFILANATSVPERTLLRGDLLNFVHQRGKVDVLAKRHEEVLKNEPNNNTSLFVLGELYAERKADPQRSIEMFERLAKAGGPDKPLVVGDSAKLAQQYLKAGRPKDGAELFEKITSTDPRLAAWHWKEAANAWLAAKDKARATAAARQALAVGPESRSESLKHFWHKTLGEVFLDTGEPGLAVQQFENAIKCTKIAGYIKDCEKKLEQAKQKVAAGGKA